MEKVSDHPLPSYFHLNKKHKKKCPKAMDWSRPPPLTEKFHKKATFGTSKASLRETIQ